MSTSLVINATIEQPEKCTQETNTGLKNPTCDDEESSILNSRKQAAAEQRKARKAARDPRNRLLSDTSDEQPKGILKNARILPTKRSASECVDDLSQIMADLNLNIRQFSKSDGKFCFHHQFFNEQEEEQNDRQSPIEVGKLSCDDKDEGELEKTGGDSRNHSSKNKCDCNKFGDNEDEDGFDDEEEEEEDKENEDKPKKSVRFDDKVYEAVFFASRLYDRRKFVKYHFSTRHHPQNNNQNKSKKKQQRQRSKSESDDESQSLFASNQNNGCRLSKSQRSRQSKRDKKKRLNCETNKNNGNKKDYQNSVDSSTSSGDDQGYHSHSFSD